MNKNNYSLGNIKAMDKTSYFSDNMGSVTLTRKGSKEVVLKNTGNEKKMQTLVLSINCDGTIDKPAIIFKGKGCSKEDKELLKRTDILVMFSDSGWINTNLTKKWLNWVYYKPKNDKLDQKQSSLLIWDSF